MAKLKILKDMFSVYSNPMLALLDRLKMHKGNKTRTLELRNGLKFCVRPNTSDISIVNEVFLYHAYDSVFANTKQTEQEGSVIIVDIGANIGVFTVFASSSMPGAKVISLEPMTDNLQMLQENIRLNNIGSRVTAIKKGIGNKTCKAVIYRNDDSDTGGGSLYVLDKKNFSGVKTEIDLITLSDLFGEMEIDRVDVLKVDCEGGEYELFYSTPQEVLQKISAMIIECHTHTVSDWRSEKQKLIVFLKDSGFEIEDIPSFCLIRAWRRA